MCCLTDALFWFSLVSARRKLQAEELAEEDEAKLLAQVAQRAKISPSHPNGSDQGHLLYRVVIQTFDACVEDEVSVQCGDCVRELFRDEDWVYVATTSGRMGFIPGSYCRPISELVNKNARPNGHFVDNRSSSRQSDFSRRTTAASSSLTLTQSSFDDSTLTRENSRTWVPRASSTEPKMSARIQPVQLECESRPVSSMRRQGSYIHALGGSHPSLARHSVQPQSRHDSPVGSRRSTTSLGEGRRRSCDSPVSAGGGGGGVVRRRQSSVRSNLSLDVNGCSSGSVKKVKLK